MACTKPEITKVRINLNNSSGTCRVCMRESKFMKALFSSDCKIVPRIQFCTGILFTDTPTLPPFICAECLSQLNIAHKFKTTCIESEKAFQQLDVKVKTEVLDNPDVKEEIEVKAEIDDLRQTGLLEKESVNPIINRAKCEAIPNATKNTINIKFIPDSTRYIPKVTPLSRRGKLIEQDQAIPNATSQTIKLKVVNCSAKAFNLMCKGNEKKIPKKYKRSPRKIRFRKSCCLKCNIRFETKEESIQHNKDIHNLCTKFVCEVCGKEFIYRTSLGQHKRIHVGSLFTCAHCPYTTVNKADLKKHSTIHTGEKNFHCHACTMTFRTSSNLHCHIRHQHSAEKTITCDHCKKSFYTKYCLKRHMDVHIKIKRYECSMCHSRFTVRSHWKRHMLSIHAVSVPRAKPGPRKTDLAIESTPSIFNDENAKSKNDLVKQDKKLTE